ncbi:MAG: FG-GAP repeat protein [Myxococcota bacterium]
MPLLLLAVLACAGPSDNKPGDDTGGDSGTDTACTAAFFADNDGDGFGAGDARSGCVVPDGYVSVDGDCADDDATRFPGGVEVCGDAIDQDCDGADVLCLWSGAHDIAEADARYLGDAADDRLGEQLVAAGDLDGDGYGDLLLARDGGNAGQDNGALWFGYGQDPLAGDIVASALPRYDFGRCLNDVAAAGDVNGDGFADVIVGTACDTEVGGYTGLARLFYGGPTRFSNDSAALGDATFGDDAEYGSIGTTVSGAGDVDGDGLADVLLADYGSVYLVYGSATPMTGRIALEDEAGWASESSLRCDGAAGLAHGDLDGDGLSDLLACDYSNGDPTGDTPGKTRLLYGGTERFFSPPKGNLYAWDASFLGPDDAGAVGMGRVLGAGDFDGDGYGDLATASQTAQNFRGWVWVFSGQATRYAGDTNASTATYAFTGAEEGGYFAESLEVVPDLDGNGTDELLVGGRDGAAWLFGGVPRVGAYGPSDADATFSGGAADDLLGLSLAAPDLDGDGQPDLVLGAPGTDLGLGAAHVFLGSGM